MLEGGDETDAALGRLNMAKVNDGKQQARA